MKISVIMPIYNCERYLEAALQSVLTQSVHDLEIIAVDDCSADASSSILLRMAMKDPRIRVILNGKNVGVAAARNIGLKSAEGDFIAFCDADDIVPPGAYEALLGAIGEKDMAIGAYDEVTDRDEDECLEEYRPVDGADKKSMFLSTFSVCCLWTKLIRASFIKKNALRFDESMRIGEDVVFLANAVTKAPSYAVVDSVVYRHYLRIASDVRSLTHVYTLATYRTHIECRKQLLSICREIPECRDYVYLRFSRDTERYLHLIDDKDEREAAFDLFREYMRGYPFEEKPKFFLGLTGVPYGDFLTMRADEYFECQREILPRRRVEAEFDCGMIGLSWIVKYFKAWFRFKIKRSYR